MSSVLAKDITAQVLFGQHPFCMNLNGSAFLLKSNLTLSLTRPGAFMHPPTTSITALYLQHPSLGLFFKKPRNEFETKDISWPLPSFF